MPQNVGRAEKVLRHIRLWSLMSLFFAVSPFVQVVHERGPGQISLLIKQVLPLGDVYREMKNAGEKKEPFNESGYIVVIWLS